MRRFSGGPRPSAPGVCALALAALAAQGAEAPRYSLAPGTHLVYREFLEKEGSGGKEAALVRGEWESHVLVTGTGQDCSAVGFQRNRKNAELVRYTENGLDRTKREAPGFADLLKRRNARFAEANCLLARGAPLLPWTVAREWSSELLFDVHEIEALPPTPLEPGGRFAVDSALGLRFEVAGGETVGSLACLRIVGSSVGSAPITLRYTFCPSEGLIAKLALEGRYSAPGQMVHETLRWELLDHRREDPLVWLQDPELQQGALAALQISAPEALPPTERLYSLLGRGDPAVDRMVLGLAYRDRLKPPALGTLEALFHGPPRVHALALRAIEGTPASPEIRDVVTTALTDSDDGVRAAALHYVQERLPAEAAAQVRDVPGVLGAWGALSALPRPQDAAAQSWIGSVLGDGALPPWRGGATGDFPERAALLRRGQSMPPGFFPGVFGKHPYVLRVPVEYRGDEPFPLLIMLSGGSGRALEGALSTGDRLDSSSALVLFPDGPDLWWEPQSTALVPRLLEKILETFDVDTNRVFLSGFSNGGSGAFLYATLFGDRLGGVASLMGAGPYVESSRKPYAANLGSLPFLFLHGDHDEVIPTRASEDTAKIVRREAPAAHVEFEVLKGVGHEITLGSDGGRTLGFLNGKKRDPFPRSVRVLMDDLAFPRRYWVELLEKEGGTAEVQADLREDGSIEVRTRHVRKLRLLLRPELLPAGKPTSVLLNGRPVFNGRLESDPALLEASLRATKDPFLAYSAELPLVP